MYLFPKSLYLIDVKLAESQRVSFLSYVSHISTLKLKLFGILVASDVIISVSFPEMTMLYATRTSNSFDLDSVIND